MHSSPTPETRQALLEAIASAWCVPPNENKRMDADLASTIADQVIGLTWLRSETAPLAPPTTEEIAAYRDRFRLELDKRMDTKHPSASPSTEAHAIALSRFVEARNAPR